MSRFIEVTFVTKEFANSNVVEFTSEEEESAATDYREETCSGMINVEDIRDFYPPPSPPRRHGPGRHQDRVQERRRPARDQFLRRGQGTDPGSLNRSGFAAPRGRHCGAVQRHQKEREK